VVRPFNTFGPRQSARAIIPTIIVQILSGKREIKLGSLTPTRDLTFVKDTANGFYKAGISKKAVGEIVNIGSNFEISIGDLVKRISKIIGRDVKVVSDKERKRPKKSEVRRLWADTNKAKRLLAWKPDYSFDKGLEETVSWFKERRGMYKADLYTV